jgi:subtilase family serine protease
VNLLRVGAVAAAAALAAACSAAPGAAPASQAMAGAAVPAVVPFAAGHVLAVGGMSAPPTTAQCESYFGIACYQSAQMRVAYNVNTLWAKGIGGQGKTIVIIDAFGSPSIAADLHAFDTQMHLPDAPSFKVITPEGSITTNKSTCTNTYQPGSKYDTCADFYSWTDETSLDVEWSHALAPKANILLVETPATETEGVYGFPQLIAAENYVVNHRLGNVITQSFGAAENTFTSTQLNSLRYAYANAAAHGITVLAASGDQGSTDYTCSGSCASPADIICCDTHPAVDWPSSDPLVTAVGGTQLHLSSTGSRTAPDNVWNDSSTTVGVPGPAYTWGAGGGGHSGYFARPSFQNGVASTAGRYRSTPDIAMSAAVNGAVDFYDTTDPNVAGWGVVGGTSEASPLFAGIIALTDQYANRGLGDINTALYALAKSGAAKSGITPIGKGSNAFTFCEAADIQSDSSCASSADLVQVPGYSANNTWNDATGWGTVNGAVFVPALARTPGA